MSDPLRVALVAEGITDYVVLRSAVEAMLHGRSFDMKLLQPEESVAFVGSGNAGAFGGGWRGVYRWCLQSAERSGGSFGDDPLFQFYDLIIVHLDADVAAENPAAYPHAPILELDGFLPCEQPCRGPAAHPHHTTDRLRRLLLSWSGAEPLPPRLVLCTPSKATDTWMMAIFFPNDVEMARAGWECHADPAGRLPQQKKKVKFKKSYLSYAERASDITEHWPRIVRTLSEAKRFHEEFQAAVSMVAD